MEKTLLITIALIISEPLLAVDCSQHGLPGSAGYEICMKQRSRMTIEQERIEKSIRNQQASYRQNLGSSRRGSRVVKPSRIVNGNSVRNQTKLGSRSSSRTSGTRIRNNAARVNAYKATERNSPRYSSSVQGTRLYGKVYGSGQTVNE